MSETPYLDAILSCLPVSARDTSESLLSASSFLRPLIELLVRLAADAPEAPPHTILSDFLANSTANDYADMRNAARVELGRLNNKRKRSATPPPDPAKRARIVLPSTPSPCDADDTPIYTLHALSVSSPVRKKLDITVHAKTLRVGNLSFPLAAVKRAFLLPTRGKVKPHWTVMLLSSDVPVRAAKGAAPPANFQVIFGVDAEPATTLTTTAHPAPAVTHAKGVASRAHLLAFLQHLPVDVFEPSANVFAPAAAGGALGLAAYQGAKEGTLWLLASGVLGEHKPAEFWPLADLDAPEGDFDAVRLQSATGRTCSVFVRRKRTGEEEGEEGEETEFGMVDGREQDGIRAWVRRFRGKFGMGEDEVAKVNGRAVDKMGGMSARLKEGVGKEKEKDAVTGMEVDEGDSDSDSNFEVSSSNYDSGSPSSSSDEDEEGKGGSDKEEDGSGSEGDDEEGGGGSDEEEELDPARHPMLRPGALPRMSKAAMDLAADMVLGDLMSRPTAEDEDEEDELED
jgi:hypothetical protein